MVERLRLVSIGAFVLVPVCGVLAMWAWHLGRGGLGDERNVIPTFLLLGVGGLALVVGVVAGVVEWVLSGDRPVTQDAAPM